MIKSIKRFLFRKNEGAQRVIVKNIAWLAIAQFVSKFAKMFVVIYAARILGANGYGVFSYAFGLAGFFVFFKNIGVDAILTREIAKKTEKEKEYISTSFWIEFVLLAITVLLIVTVAPFFSNIEEALPLLPLVAFVIVFDDLRGMSVAFFRGKEKMQVEALVIVIWNIAIAILGFIALKVLGTPLAFVLAYMGGSLVGLAISVILLKREVKSVLKYFDRKLVRPILKSAWPFAVISGAGVLLFGFDIVMLGFWREASEIGLYSASQKIISVLGLFAVLVSITTLPALSRVVSEGSERSKKAIESVLRSLFLLAIPLTVGGFAVGDGIIRFVFGEGFSGAVIPFYILLPTVLATYPIAIYINMILSHDKQIKIIPIIFISSAVNILLNFFLIQKFGIIGASVATLVAFLTYSTLLCLYVKKIVSFRIVNGLGKIILSSLIMGIIAFVFVNSGVHVILAILASVLIYFALLFLMRDKTLMEMLGSISKRFNSL